MTSLHRTRYTVWYTSTRALQSSTLDLFTNSNWKGVTVYRSQCIVLVFGIHGIKIKSHEIVLKLCIPSDRCYWYELWMSCKLLTLNCYFPEITPYPPPPKKKICKGGGGASKESRIWFDIMNTCIYIMQPALNLLLIHVLSKKSPHFQLQDLHVHVYYVYGPFYLTSQKCWKIITVWPWLSGNIGISTHPNEAIWPDKLSFAQTHASSVVYKVMYL